MATKPKTDRTGQPPEIAAIEAAVVALRRSYRRRAISRLSKRRGERAGAYAALPDAVFELLDALDAAAERADALTVTEVAAVLDVDQPRASRLAAQAVDAGLVRRGADQHDGRRSLLVLTPQGRTALERIRAFRQRVIAEATRDWTVAERAALADLLTRFVRDIAAVTRPAGDR
ncbi:MAG: MarR family winged helix-turn-helix transcriptional regulator [Micromonosporaceae bacterium]